MQLHINILFATTIIVFLFILLFRIYSQAQLFPIGNDIQDGSDDNIKDVKKNYPITVKDDNTEEEKKESEPTLPKSTISDEIDLLEKLIMWLMEIL